VNYKIAATVAVGAASTIAIERLRSRPTLASAAAVCGRQARSPHKSRASWSLCPSSSSYSRSRS